MATFKMKTNPVEAHVIDAAWALFLEKEHGVKDVKLGDYVYYTPSFNLEVMPKERFERLFEPLEV